MVRAHIFYSGIVQGVGFRYAVQRFARELDVSGWVRNLSDGRVEILAEGSQENIQAMMDRVDERFGHSIRSKQTDFLSPTGMLTDFQIAPTN